LLLSALRSLLFVLGISLTVGFWAKARMDMIHIDPEAERAGLPA
jgi:hypothetical protein